MYPLFYWMFMLVITVHGDAGRAARPPRQRTSHWKTERVVPDEEPVPLSA